MARSDPVERNMIRMELRRFQTRCEAQQGTLQRADTVREVARLANISIPFQLSEEVEALDTRRELRRYAEQKARELFEEYFDRLRRAEANARPKIEHQIDDEIAQLTGPLNPLRTWAQAQFHAVRQMLDN